MRTNVVFSLLIIIFFLLLSSCSINKMAMNMIADALTGEGSSDVFTGDSDPQLVGDAIPFAIKMYEALLSQNPKHQGLINTTGSMFIMYANAFVQGPAEMLPVTRYLERQEALARAKKLYLRGLDILYQGLELKYPGFESAYANGRLSESLAKMNRSDVPALYWSAAGGLSAFSLNPFDLDLGMRIMEFYAMVERAYELNPDFNDGALDEFLLIFHASIPAGMGSDRTMIEPHFQRALEKSKGASAGTYVAYAQAVCIPAQDHVKFKEMLEKALAVNIDANPSNRLVNIISQRKARYLLDSTAQFFVLFDSGDDWDDSDW
ncbi:MAG: TRAP transporter TatT component family protein [Treponema sp.]|nr:TRAP transporter TatT component family protein [Treponema sp.]